MTSFLSYTWYRPMNMKGGFFILIEIPYDRIAAVQYAHIWAYRRNPRFYDFENIGGDCTNFASQCVYAGCGVMNYTPTFGWYYIDANNRSPSWTGVQYFYDFLIGNKGVGPFAEQTDVEEMLPGDVIQLNFDGSGFAHTPVIVEAGSPASLDNILVAAHSMDSDYRPLTTYQWEDIRFIHILAARRATPDRQGRSQFV